ncbi:hypothetical protein GO986_05315 [Deinococcus sp. HMF7620]|uniref:Uncharacterized protein n=1 Tax=Deinococcus arboris TaxID=2682977 RepID=A0A7C9LJU4_9DEIO|nr:hypothetical protein [Deinococcus arboris]MVN86178.1 hypothetical protein [Deinococcus arboris]
MGRRVTELVAGLCGETALPLAPPLLAWAEASRPFLTFLDHHQSKVRRKLRQASGPEELADVAAELGLAAWLLGERRWTLVYEPLAASGRRGPDFQVASPDGGPGFFVEVTRLRPASTQATLVLKLARTVADKVGQLPAGAVNVLAVVLPPDTDGAPVWSAALRLLTAGAPAASGLDSRAFARGRAGLAALLLFSSAPPQAPGLLVPLPGARHPLPAATVRRLRALARYTDSN